MDNNINQSLSDAGKVAVSEYGQNQVGNTMFLPPINQNTNKMQAKNLITEGIDDFNIEFGKQQLDIDIDRSGSDGNLASI